MKLLRQIAESFFGIVVLCGRNFEKLETDALSKRGCVLTVNLQSVFKIHFVCNHNSGQVAAVIVLFDGFQPLSERVETFRICCVIHQSYHICFAQKFVRNFLENVLSCDIQQMQLDSCVGLFNHDVFYCVFTPLRHVIVVIELLLGHLLDDLCFSDGWFSHN